MKLLLIGASGQLGRNIVGANENAKRPFEIISPSRKQLDLANPRAIWRELEHVDFDLAVNCTGCHDVDEVERTPDLAFTVNSYAVRELAQVCETKAAAFVHLSTDYVFGGDETRTAPLTEQSPAAPVNVYGCSKLLGENLAALACDNVFVLRVAVLFGVGGMSASGTNFVEAVLAKGKKGDEFAVVQDQTISPTGTEDLAMTILDLAQDRPAPGIYNAVNTGQITRFEFARAILHQAKLPDLVRPCKSEKYTMPAMRPKFSALDNSKLCSVTSEVPGWYDALARYLEARTDN